MISYFPKLYDDEIFYSAIARYAVIRDSTSYKETVREVFGSNYKTIFELPSHIHNFVSQVKHFDYFNEEDIIANHTLFNYFTAFMSLKDKEQVKGYMSSLEANRIYSKVGLLATTVKLTERVKICCKCILESVDKNGEYFINRHHQLPGVFFCHLHENEVLVYSNLEIRNGNRQKFKMDFDLFNMDYVNALPPVYQQSSDSKYDVLFKEITRRSLIISTNRMDTDLVIVKQVLRKRLDELGFLSITGSINSSALRRLVNEWFDKDAVELFGFDIFEINWLLDLLRRNLRKTHPLKYIIATMILDIDIVSLYRNDIKLKSELLPCLNKLCLLYKEEIIEKYKITADFKSRERVVTVVCPRCGYTYSRKWIAEKHKIGRVKDFGWLWHEKLPDVLENNELSLRAKAKVMGCDTGTIKKYLIASSGIFKKE